MIKYLINGERVDVLDETSDGCIIRDIYINSEDEEYLGHPRLISKDELFISPVRISYDEKFFGRYSCYKR